ncbi:MAG: hypothetical protein JNJ57_11835 [Saprospiraceae bacterium]|nr:hypothetical protein [Saprospiraceae bacterium]
MNKLKNLTMAAVVLCATTITGCLHIIEEATFRNNGSGTYKMTVDMGELKGMMEMMKGMGDMEGMGGDSTEISDGGDYTPPADGEEDASNPMSGLGKEFSGVAESLKNLPGISNVTEINDTSTFNFGYSFDFVDVNALNRALKVVGKEKYDSKNEETFKFNGKSFERLGVGDLGAEIKKALAENGGSEEEEGQMDMMKMFFTDMSYKQVYNFPDRKVKSVNNKLGEKSEDAHTVTITIKPFNEEQQKQKVSVATKIKLK